MPRSIKSNRWFSYDKQSYSVVINVIFSETLNTYHSFFLIELSEARGTRDIWCRPCSESRKDKKAIHETTTRTYNEERVVSSSEKKTWMSSLFRQATACLSLLSLPSKSSKILRGRQLLKLVMCSNVIILRSYCHQQINCDQ